MKNQEAVDIFYNMTKLLRVSCFIHHSSRDLLHMVPDAQYGQVFPMQHLIPLRGFHRHFVSFRFFNSGLCEWEGDHLAKRHLAG